MGAYCHFMSVRVTLTLTYVMLKLSIEKLGLRATELLRAAYLSLAFLAAGITCHKFTSEQKLVSKKSAFQISY